MSRFANLIASWLVAFAMAACAFTGTPAPQTFNQRLVAGYASVEAVASTAAQLRAAGKLSDADRDNVVSTSRTALAGLDLAAQVAKTNPAAGQDKLTATIAVLTAMQLYLASKEGK